MKGRLRVPQHRETRMLPWTAEQLFDLVADVRRYPEFLPWVAAVRIRSSEPELLVADMAVGFKALRETFTSRVELQRPTLIHVDYVSGPLRHLQNEWRFTQEPEATRLEFMLDFEFRSKVFEKLAGAFFSEAFRRMVGSFEQRAEALYGSNKRNAASTA